MRWQTTLLFAALAVITCAMALRAEEAVAKKPLPTGKSCQGTLRLGDKTYKLEHVVAYENKLGDEVVIAVLLCDYPIPLAKLKTALRESNGSDDRFIHFRPKVKVTFSKDGKPLSFNAWASNTSLSVSGSNELKGKLTIKDGRVSGTASFERTDKPDSKDGYDASFDVALLVVPLSKTPPQAAATGKPKGDPDDDDAPAKASPVVRVGDLPIPKDASDIEYKQLVGHIGFKSKSDVKKLSAALVKDFKQQGWKSDDDDLVTPASAILKRTKGRAELTIFIKPDGAGSTVTIMSEGLTWAKNDADDAEEE